PVRVLPVPDPGYFWQVIDGESRAADFHSIGQKDGDMPENSLPVGLEPGDEVLCDPLLSPSPPFAAAPALEAVLARCLWSRRVLSGFLSIFSVSPKHYRSSFPGTEFPIPSSGESILSRSPTPSSSAW